MRAPTKALILLLALPAACTTWETYPESVASPEEAWLTIRAALLSESPKVLYRCLSPEFKRRHGLTSLARLRVAFEEERGEWAALARLVADAEPGVPRVLGDGVVRLPVHAAGRTADLVFVEVPTFTVRMEGDEHHWRRDWRRGAVVDGERLRIDQPLDPSLDLETAEDAEEIRFHVRWLLSEFTLRREP